MSVPVRVRRVLLAAAVFLAIAASLRLFLRVSYEPSTSLLYYGVLPYTSGDEPHYLMVIHSLLFDHDLDLRSDYRRVEEGEIRAGVRFRGRRLDRHVIWIDPATGKHGFGQVPARLDPAPGILERSAHPIGFPALVAAVLSLCGTRPPDVESRAILVVTLLSAATVVLTFCLARAAGCRPKYAAFSCGLLLLASPWLSYSGSLYTEVMQGFFLTAAVLALSRNRPGLAGFCLGMSVTVKPALAVVVFGIVMFLWWKRRRAEAFRVSVLAGAIGGGLVAFNEWQTRMIVVNGPAGWKWTRTLAGAFGHWISPDHGLLAFVPWAAIALIPIARSLRRGAGEGREALGLLAAGLVPFAITLSAFAFTGGDCYGPRYWVPFLPWLAVGGGLVLERESRFLQTAVVSFAAIGAGIAISGALSRGYARNVAPFAPAWDLAAGAPRWTGQIAEIARSHIARIVR